MSDCSRFQDVTSIITSQKSHFYCYAIFRLFFYLTWISVQDYRSKEEEPLNQQNNTLEDPEKKLLRTPFLLWVHLSALGYVINKEKSSIAKPEN